MPNTMTTAKTITKADLKSKDFVPRGLKSSSPLTTTLFVSLRILDCLIQYHILSDGLLDPLIRLLGGTVIPTPPTPYALNLSPYRLALLAMLCATCAKHIWFATRVIEEAWTVRGALGVGTYNIAINALNSLLFLTAATSATSTPAAAAESLSNPYLLAGSALFALGIGAESHCEVQRRAFKRRPANAGKPFTSGLFGVVRHPNYAGYTLWRGALGMATSGPLSAVGIAGFFLWDFWARAVPALDEYCSMRDRKSVV